MSAPAMETKEQHQFVDALGFLCTQKRTGGLLVRAEGREGEVFLQEGMITHAQFGSLTGLQALLFMLAWEKWTYNFTPQQTSDQTTIEMKAAEILSLLAHQTEEWRHISQERSWNLDTVLRLLPQASGSIRLTKEEWDILARIDGMKSLEDISSEMNLPPLDLVKSVQRFCDAGLIGAGPGSPDKVGAVFGAAYLSALEQELMLTVGPVASIVLEEAAKDLQAPGKPLTEDQIEILIERLSKAITEEEKRSSFQQAARSLAAKFSAEEELPHKEKKEEETE
jgi:hypothetical protein